MHCNAFIRRSGHVRILSARLGSMGIEPTTLRVVLVACTSVGAVQDCRKWRHSRAALLGVTPRDSLLKVVRHSPSSASGASSSRVATVEWGRINAARARADSEEKLWRHCKSSNNLSEDEGNDDDKEDA